MSNTDRIENATVSTNKDLNDDLHVVEVNAIVEGMKYNFKILLSDLAVPKDEDEHYQNVPRHEMAIYQNDCLFMDGEITANPEFAKELK